MLTRIRSELRWGGWSGPRPFVVIPIEPYRSTLGDPCRPALGDTVTTMVSAEESLRAFGDRYRLLKLVGEGSSALVYLAEDLTLHRRIALKIVRAEIADDADFRDRFAAEMRATAVLNHPRVLPVHDWGLDPAPYTVTEYLAGGSLAMVLGAGRRLSPSQALVVGLEAARALGNIHAGGRAHLGLAPSAILFDSGARPYISDLGLSAALAAAEPAGGSDEQESAPVSYSPLQQAQDVHDLALVLCEAVTGASLLSHDGDDAAMATLTALGPLQAVLERATATDPAEPAGERTAAWMAQELLRVAALLPRPDPIPLESQDSPPTASTAVVYDQTEDFARVGPSVSERSAVPLDDVPRRRWPGIVLAAILVVGGTFGGIWAWLAIGSDAAPVPDLEGRTQAAAVSAATDLGWTVNEVLVREPGTSRGQVVRTEPPAGTSLGEGATLDVFVSLGEPLIPVSNLRFFGMTVEEATDELEALNLGVGDVTRVYDDVVPSGNVVGLDVDEGVYELEPGDEVDLLVSDGPSEAP